MTLVVDYGRLGVEDIHSSVNQQRGDKMTIDEAIRVKQNNAERYWHLMTQEEVDADNLSVEAMKAYSKSQANGWYPPGYKLPGETEE